MKTHVVAKVICLGCMLLSSTFAVADVQEFRQSIRSYRVESSTIDPESAVKTHCYGPNNLPSDLRLVANKEFRMQTHAEDFLEEYKVFVDGGGETFKVTTHYEYNTDYYGENSDYTIVQCLF